MKKCDPELTGNKEVDRGGAFYLQASLWEGSKKS